MAINASVAADIDLLLKVSAEAEAAERRAAEVRQAVEDVAAHPILSRDNLTEADVVEWLQFVFDRDRAGATAVRALQAATVQAAVVPVEVSGYFDFANLIKHVAGGKP